MTFATTLRLSLCGAAISAALGLTACSNNATDPAVNADDSANNDKPAKTLAITQIVEHPSLDEMRRGIIDELADNGYAEGPNSSPVTIQMPSSPSQHLLRNQS